MKGVNDVVLDFQMKVMRYLCYVQTCIYIYVTSIYKCMHTSGLYLRDNFNSTLILSGLSDGVFTSRQRGYANDPVCTAISTCICHKYSEYGLFTFQTNMELWSGTHWRWSRVWRL